MSMSRFVAFTLIGSWAASAALGQQPLRLDPGPANQPPSGAPTAEDEASARQALCERFCDLGLALQRQRYSKASLRQSEAFLAAAATINPTEPRYFRYLAQAREAEGDLPGAIETWRAYLILAPEDQVAQMDLIDLYLARQQSNEAKIAYLRQLVASPKLDVHVKAHVAMLAVPLLDQRSRSAALAMLAQARRFYPLPEVTLLEYRLLPPDATAIQRFAALLDILRANPVDAEAIAEVADMLSEAGFGEQALVWYATLIDVHLAQGTLPTKDSLVNYLAERYRAGETTVASEQLEQNLQIAPEDSDFWFLRLTIQRGDESPQILKEAQQAFLRRLNLICERIVPERAGAALVPATHPATRVASTQPATSQAVATQPAATAQATTRKAIGLAAATQSAASQPAATQPTVVASAIPVDQAVRRVKSGDDAEYKDALARSLYETAWFEIYFNHDVNTASPWIAAMKQLVPADNAVLKRLEGWSDLVAGKNDAARAIFTPLQNSDPLSALGLFHLEEVEKHDKAAEELGQKILSNPHSGVLGAILYQATRGRGFKATTQPADAAPIQAELQKFPRQWLDVVHAPGRTYALRAEPIKVGHRLGEPLLANVTIQNVGKMDVTIGDFGLIKPILTFDGQIRGVNERNFPGVAFDRIMGRQVLGPGESITQTVRLDQAELSDALRLRPTVMLLINADVITNAVRAPNGFRALAGGYARVFSRMFTRVAEPLSLDISRRNLIKDLHEGAPGDKILDIDLLSAYVAQYSVPDAAPDERAFAQQFAALIDNARADPAPGVKLWASYAFALLVATPQEQTKAVDQMLSSNAWESRLLGIYASRLLSMEVQKQLAAKMAASDPNPLVKSYAAATVEYLQTPTTQPTTAPATPR
ncbi:MAG TPA: hypothetical protein VG326_17965 [Tepidisphaeraceae bacterium]|jgi:tetratricopeptide (TPR) repeat protein|nr:hypothetical protein [Tepidisphaeraceae bacterium]